MPKFDLHQEFDDANQKYFDGKLRPIEMKFERNISPLGRVRATVNKTGQRINYANIMYLGINDKYDYTREQFLSTFLHELCHVYMLQQADQYRWSGGYHGYEWQRLADDVSSKSGIPITAVESTAVGYAHSDTAKVQRYVIITKYPSAKGTQFIVAWTTPSVWAKIGTEVMSYLNSRPDGIKSMVFRTDDPEVDKYAKKFVKARPQFYNINPEAALKYIENNKDNITFISN